MHDYFDKNKLPNMKKVSKLSKVCKIKSMRISQSKMKHAKLTICGILLLFVISLLGNQDGVGIVTPLVAEEMSNQEDSAFDAKITNSRDVLAAQSSNDTLDIILIIVFSTLLVLFFWYQKRSLLTYLTIIVGTVLVDIEIESSLSKDHKLQQKLETYQVVSTLAGKLESTLSNNLALLSGFAAYISAEPDLNQESYDNYAAQLFKNESLLINFAAAKDLIVNYVYPYKGNEKVIGLDYKKHPIQRTAVMQVVKRKTLMVIGPINLVQGGTAFIGRVPIFRSDNGVLWGIISAPIDADGVYKTTNVYQVEQDYHVAIRNFDADGRPGDAFYGESDAFRSFDSTIIKIPIGGSHWEVALAPKNPPLGLQQNITLIRSVLILTILIIVAFAFFRFRQEKERLLLISTIKSNQELLENVGQVANIGGWKMDTNEYLFEWTEQASVAIHKPRDFKPEFLQDFAEIFTENYYTELEGLIERAYNTQQDFDVELQLYSQEGAEYWVRVIATVTNFEDDIILSGTIQDATDSVMSTKLIEHQATYDSLTQLPNRVVFNDRLQKAVSEAKRKNTKLCVLFIDMDRFKPINDTHGHAVGDLLLQETAAKISRCVRDSDTVSRLSGDEFGAILQDIGYTSNILRVVENIICTMQQPFIIEGHTLHCSVSIGIAIYPDDDVDAKMLIRKADQAMYEVKSSGKNGWHFYTKEMQQKTEKRHAILHDLIEAIDNKELIPYLQPIVDLKTNKIVKCEALARWPQANGDFISPGEFIALAEETGLVNKIDLSMMKQAGDSITKTDPNLRVALSINVSPRLFGCKDHSLEHWLILIEDLSKTLEITVEITERLLTDDSEKSLEVLCSLKKLGVKIAIDDFGTGYSSLSYLVKFPVDIIKIDQSFVCQIDSEDNTSNTLIETILVMAQRLDIKVVAEGIETVEQLKFLVDHGCDFGQGYLLGRPMTMEAFKQTMDLAS
jgi:diguanylate cyclase (GGDEF)-like protein